MAPLKVLIIEDDKSTADFFRTVLKLVGLESEILLSAKEALDRLAFDAPDLILLDIRLGVEISGEDILYQIRSNPRFDKTRVVVITAYPRLAEPITELADLILVKPVETEQLKSLMERLRTMDFHSKFQGCRDPITELFNEEFFLARLELAFQRTRRRSDFRFAMIAIDVQIDALQNARLSPDAMLAILREIASRLRTHIRPTDAAARLSGWRFATLHEDLKDAEVIQIILKRLQEKLALPFVTCDGTFEIQFEMKPVVHQPGFQKAADILTAAQKASTDEPAREKP
jgi:diguanylate cyclase (GGDEF)-like protein